MQPFKKGRLYRPDVAHARRRPPATSTAADGPGRDRAGQFAQPHARDADVGLVEGNKGLYDGLALDGSNSNAALAAQLGLPVLLVLDARGMTRGIAPLILGYRAFDRASASAA